MEGAGSSEKYNCERSEEKNGRSTSSQWQLPCRGLAGAEHHSLRDRQS